MLSPMKRPKNKGCGNHIGSKGGTLAQIWSLFDSGTVGVCARVRMYILTLERGDRSGYLLLLPLLHMLKVMDDRVHVSYALLRGIRHVLYDARHVSYDAFIS